ncbi:MAG: hypothetical protein Q8Q89_00910 [bacterium]|nr:hypothetical protein [bacterium]
MITETKVWIWHCDFCNKEQNISSSYDNSLPFGTFYLKQKEKYSDSFLENHFCNDDCLLRFVTNLATSKAFGFDLEKKED